MGRAELIDVFESLAVRIALALREGRGVVFDRAAEARIYRVLDDELRRLLASDGAGERTREGAR